MCPAQTLPVRTEPRTSRQQPTRRTRTPLSLGAAPRGGWAEACSRAWREPRELAAQSGAGCVCGLGLRLRLQLFAAPYDPWVGWPGSALFFSRATTTKGTTQRRAAVPRLPPRLCTAKDGLSAYKNFDLRLDELLDEPSCAVGRLLAREWPLVQNERFSWRWLSRRCRAISRRQGAHRSSRRSPTHQNSSRSRSVR